MARGRGQPSRPTVEQASAEEADDHDGEAAHDRRDQGADDLDGARGRCPEPITHARPDTTKSNSSGTDTAGASAAR